MYGRLPDLNKVRSRVSEAPLSMPRKCEARPIGEVGRTMARFKSIGEKRGRKNFGIRTFWCGGCGKNLCMDAWKAEKIATGGYVDVHLASACLDFQLTNPSAKAVVQEKLKQMKADFDRKNPGAVFTLTSLNPNALVEPAQGGEEDSLGELDPLDEEDEDFFPQQQQQQQVQQQQSEAESSESESSDDDVGDFVRALPRSERPVQV